MHELPVAENQVLAERYRVDRILGQGGMGFVVAAEHLRLGHQVAIKVLLPECAANPEIVGRFLNEAKAAARIRSDHVVRVSDVGELEGGAPYMVMELLEGRDLSETLKTGGPLSIDLAVDYVLQACHGVRSAHGMGIVHRDLKPSNLFLTTRSDGAPLVKVLDFGISKAVGPNKTGTVTATGELFGSPTYMSPEQLVGAKNVDGRSDVWSLGIILHELLTGTTPFMADTVGALFLQIANGAPAQLRSLRPDAPVDLEQVILRCLEKDVARRFQSVAEFEQALRSSVGWAARSYPRASGDLSAAAAALSLRGNAVAPQETGRTFGLTAQPGKRAGRKKRFGVAMLAAALAVAGVVFWATRVRAPSSGNGSVASANFLESPPSTSLPAAAAGPATQPEPPAPPPEATPAEAAGQAVAPDDSWIHHEENGARPVPEKSAPAPSHAKKPPASTRAPASTPPSRPRRPAPTPDLFDDPK
jgi:serine/threonine-protein kinase